MMVFIAVAVSFVFLQVIIKYYDDRVYQRAAILAFSGHIAISVIILPRLPYQWDIGEFHQVATEIATGASASSSITVNTFSTFQALLYVIFAPRIEIVAIFNSLFAVLVAIPVAYLAKALYVSKKREPTAVILATLFLPLPFLFLSIPMRDSLSVLLFFAFLGYCTCAIKRYTPYRALAAIPLWGMLYLLRPELGLIVALGVVTAMSTEALNRYDISLSPQLFTFILGGIGCLGFGLFAELVYSFDQINDILNRRTRGGATYLEGMEYGSWFDFLLAVPTRGIYFQFAPFPLHVESIFHLLGLVDSVLLIILFVSAVRSLYRCSYDETVAVFLIVVYLAGIVGYGSINGNFGTNVRHRIVFDFMLVIFASPVLQSWWSRVRTWFGVTPSQSSHKDEQKRETQELDRRI
jgi:hypothetical protein